jgi:hypothetical protein
MKLYRVLPDYQRQKDSMRENGEARVFLILFFCERKSGMRCGFNTLTTRLVIIESGVHFFDEV